MGLWGIDGKPRPRNGAKARSNAFTSSLDLTGRRVWHLTSTKWPVRTGTRCADTAQRTIRGKMRISSLRWYSSVRSTVLRSG